MSDIKCPYCGHDQDVCHDDGQGYEEDQTHEMCCYECERHFVFHTSISFHYTPKKADCLNGEDHTYEPTNTYPVECTKMACSQCDWRRKPTEAEMNEIIKLRA